MPEGDTHEVCDVAADRHIPHRHPSSWAIDLSVEQAKEIAEILRLGGTAIVDEQAADGPTVGADFADFTDARFEDLKGLKNLQILRLRGPYEITDAGLKHIADFTQLRELLLTSYRVTDSGFAHLRGLKHLRKLSLFDTEVTGAGFGRTP